MTRSSTTCLRSYTATTAATVSLRRNPRDGAMERSAVMAIRRNCRACGSGIPRKSLWSGWRSSRITPWPSWECAIRRSLASKKVLLLCVPVECCLFRPSLTKWCLCNGSCCMQGLATGGHVRSEQPDHYPIEAHGFSGRRVTLAFAARGLCGKKSDLRPGLTDACDSGACDWSLTDPQRRKS